MVANSESSEVATPPKTYYAEYTHTIEEVTNMEKENATEMTSEVKRNVKNKCDEDEEAKLPPVSFITLFKFAKGYELALMVIGVLAAFIGGLGTPAMLILFGGLTKAFVYEDLNLTTLIIEYPQYNESYLIDYLGIGNFEHEIAIFGIGSTVIAAIQCLMGYIFVTALNYAAEGQIFRLRGLFLRSVLSQEIGWFDTNQTNDFASRVTEDLNKIQEAIGEKVGMLVFFVTTFLASLVTAFIYGWQLTLVILSVFPLLGISTAVLAKVQSSLTAVELKEYARAGSIAEEAISAIRTVIAFGGEAEEVRRYEKNLVHAKNAGMKRGLTTGLGMGMMWFFIYSSYALAFWYGTKLVLGSRPPNGDGQYDASNLVIVFFNVLMGAMNVGQSAPYIEAINIGRGAAASIFKIIERKSKIDPTEDHVGDKPQEIIGTVEFKDVFFNYPSRPDVKILQGVTFEINPGQTVALVGSSGCGKSTCIQLLQRFYDPAKGSIILDGQDICTLNLGWLRDQIGVVGQEPVLFAATIEENIRYGKDGVSFDEIKQAAKESNAHDFIMKLPQQYDTLVGERGVQISGGQKQRIAIARALIKRPKVLLLDEATSALDTQSEAIVQQALDKVRKGRTTIIVAHRLTTIRTADLIIAMQDGKIMETGTHEHLMAKDGLYKMLVTAQLSNQNESEEFEELNLEDYANEMEPDNTLEEILDDLSFKSPLPLSRTPSFRRSIKRRRRSSTYSTTSRQKPKLRSLGKTKTTEKKEEKNMTAVSTIEILKMNAAEWHYILGGIIGASVQGCLLPAYAILFGNVMGTLSIDDPELAREEANFISLLFLMLGVIAAISMFFQAYMFALSGEILTMRLRKLVFKTMLHQEMGWFDDESNSVGALCSRLSTDASAVQGATGSRLGTVVQVVVTLGFSIILSFIYDAKLAAVGTPFVPLVFIAVYLQSKVIMGQTVTESKVLEDASKIAMEAIGNIRTVASLHKERLFAERYSYVLYKTHLEAKKTSHIRGMVFGFSQALPFFAYAVIIFYGGHLVSTKEMRFQEVFKVGEAMIFGSMMVGQAVAFAPNFNKAKVAAAKVMALLQRRPAIDNSVGVGLRMTGEVHSISLKDVQFSYPTRPSLQVLQGMNVKVKKGQSIALVGSSGCGKSTIINLLERFYNPTNGFVYMNDTDILALNVGYVRSLFGLVSQEPVLFDRSIAENIAYGENTRTFSQRDIEEVAKYANIHDFVKLLPDGYETRVGAKGTQLSGGQKQRIAIARALIRNPQVLLLDEATSALDAESEKIVQETLEDVRKDRTSIIIAHRLSTIRNVDKIIVFQAGKVIEEGTHEELMLKKGHYYDLYQTSV